ncbi:Nucleotide-binding universal stress protein, UspA family [Ectothiorhodospira magna]|uniref:Nucleotide-binding universal stress protein, UspA family n=1 Tax=Ectothiorhodospira magna TaxID=867345 RepID=A0A1H9DPK0_9GAMM|nr:universal stress protein [Ectothiorhodospira magna]SEQ15436.1 Nucleotide-binding universal stress protein, UspA family [Ectothiorhodospira magna]
MPLSKILFATDLSPGADHAGRRALQLATAEGARLRVINVIPAPSLDETVLKRWRGDTHHLMADLMAATEQALAERMTTLGASDDLAMEIRCLRGQGHKQILTEAREFGADLIVVGSHGQRSFKDILLGTTTQNLVHHADRPILVVKQPVQGAYRRIVVPVDYSERTRKALHLAAALSPDDSLHAVHAYDMDALDQVLRHRVVASEVARIKQEVRAEQEQALNDFLAGCGLPPARLSAQLRLGYAPTVVEQAVKEWGAELVVMGTHGRNRLQDALLGGVARRVVHQVQAADVLLIRD